MRWNPSVFLLLIGLWSFAADRGLAWADEFDVAELQAEIRETIDRVRPAAVWITGRGSSFSGVIVSTEGQVLSVAHAVEPGARYRVNLPDGRQLRGVGKGANPRSDAALIQITDPPDDLPFVPMGDSSSLVTNQPCIGLSYPGGQKVGGEPVVRFGHVVRNGRRGMLQSSVFMEPGDSGGPLVDLNGCVVGIHSRIGVSMDRNFEVPVDVFRRYWNELNYERVFIHSGPPMPELGVRLKGPRRDEEAVEEETPQGLAVEDVVDGGMAAKAGIQDGDRLLALFGRALVGPRDLHEALVAARDEGAETVTATVLRDDEERDLEILFDVDREAAPEVALPASDLPEVPEPQGYAELARLPSQFAEFEAALDDACVVITSRFDEEATRRIVGTRVLGTPWILSKSTEVGEQPEVTVDGDVVSLEVIARNADNDLVLLRSPMVNELGIDLEQADLGQAGSDLTTGTFVLSPDADGDGLVSVVGSPAFRSDKWQSRGFLGVMPGTYGNNEGAVLNHVSDDGAAMRAGLLVGDIITKLNDTIIRTQNDLRSFLAEADPNAVIQATLRREEDELIKPVVLGSVPVMSSHAADQIAKSGRRDGFAEVVPHDADLKPEECGGPLFTLQGEFLGLNIARHSRVRSYLLPADVVKDFLESSTESQTP